LAKYKKVPGHTKKQRAWVLKRDGHQCMFHQVVGGQWNRCKRTKNLEVHHILPRGFASMHAPDRFKVNNKDNLIILCHRCHCKIHTDILAAQGNYSKNPNSYKEVFQTRHELSKNGQPYWNTRYDWMFRLIVEKFNEKMTKPYPQGKCRTIGKWRKEREKEEV